MSQQLALTGAGRREVYIHPGELLATRDPHQITTILGSCVAVCLFDEQLRVGGMNHFMLPYRAVGEPSSARHGKGAIDALIVRMMLMGCSKSNLRAKVFGGACVLNAFRGAVSSMHLGERNGQVARQELSRHGIDIVAAALGGDHGRKLIFQTDDGSAFVREL